ncbi:amidohydrolase family protein [Alphaproteobacteria bacterium KMM 3653]|uniref:Amidohydrolase family protein n=1 Tax=Harenicola maris TaxID=2841044 RepID=A0AAP2G2F6_9RHOB|nr:amidohydrolase family protein [Harenicola maris]
MTELDAAAPNNPLYLLRNYSNGFANTAAFDALDIDNGASAVLSGRDGLAPFTDAVTWRNKTSSPEAILNYMSVLNGMGLTMVYDVGRPSEGNLDPLEDLAAKRDLPLRVFHTLRYSASDEASTNDALELINGGAKPFSNDPQFGLLGLGEHIYAPMLDNANWTKEWEEGTWGPFSEISFAAARNGWTVHEHVMSQATAVQYLNLIEDIAKEIPEVSELRWTFAHVNGIQDEDIARAAELGVAFGVHSQARMSVRAMDAPRIGSLSRSGALWGLGSDAGIVAPANPFWTLEWAISGTNVAGRSGWSEDQRVSREQALRAHTTYNAKLLFVEDDLGTLEVGKLADLVVLDQDYMTIEATEISSIKPVLTMTGGEVVYQSAD